MLCQRCHQRQATVFFSQTVNQETTQAHLCEVCALEQNQAAGGVLPFGFNPFAAMSQFMNDFMGFDMGAIAEVQSGRTKQVGLDPQLQCPHCGYQLSTFRQNGRLGCTKCYGSFKAALEPLISSVHGNVRHVEEAPPSEKTAPPAVDRRSQDPEVKALREKITEAIQAEKYEEAARLRDEIKKLENK